MSIWIRSQGKESLIEATTIYFKRDSEDFENSLCRIMAGNHFAITILGAYATEERALEVLDEIQMAIIDNQYIKYGRIGYAPGTSIFEMPKE